MGRFDRGRTAAFLARGFGVATGAGGTATGSAATTAFLARGLRGLGASASIGAGLSTGFAVITGGARVAGAAGVMPSFSWISATTLSLAGSFGVITPEGTVVPAALVLLNSRVSSAAVCLIGSVIERRRSVIWSRPVVLLISRWNSPPMRRMVATTLPSRFITTGKSFGPMTTSATMPISSISVQPTPNI